MYDKKLVQTNNKRINKRVKPSGLVVHETPCYDWVYVLYFKNTRKPHMDVLTLFRGLSLEPRDQVRLARAFQLCLHVYGKDQCWQMDRTNHSVFEGFNTSNKLTLFYQGIDARPLILALSGRFQEAEQVAVRAASCKSPYCFNPTHYFWGTKSEVAIETQSRKNEKISLDVVQKVRNERQEGVQVLELSRKYKLPYHVTRRICSGKSYSNFSNNKEKISDTEVWKVCNAVCELLIQCYPETTKECNLAQRVANHLECPWHQKGKPGHKGNFGLMGECLDCMEEIKKGRCTVDVRKFDLDWYWQVKRFWEQVDIKSDTECWLWKGSTRRQNKESLAYFPSPFHSGKTQSASRVAFWLSRGYTGKYRVFNKNTCQAFCCNPLHITIRELKGCPEPTGIADIQLTHTNVFQHYRKSLQQEQPSSAVKLPPS